MFQHTPEEISSPSNAGEQGKALRLWEKPQLIELKMSATASGSDTSRPEATGPGDTYAPS